MRARTGLWEPRVGNDPRRPDPEKATSRARLHSVGRTDARKILAHDLARPRRLERGGADEPLAAWAVPPARRRKKQARTSTAGPPRQHGWRGCWSLRSVQQFPEAAERFLSAVN